MYRQKQIFLSASFQCAKWRQKCLKERESWCASVYCTRAGSYVNKGYSKMWDAHLVRLYRTINLGETFTWQLTALLVHTRPKMFYISLVLLVEPPPDKHWYYTAVLSCTWSDSTHTRSISPFTTITTKHELSPCTQNTLEGRLVTNCDWNYRLGYNYKLHWTLCMHQMTY